METKFTELNDAIREFHEVFGHELPSLPQEPVLSDNCIPSNEQQDRELTFITLSMIGIGGTLRTECCFHNGNNITFGNLVCVKQSSNAYDQSP